MVDVKSKKKKKKKNTMETSKSKRVSLSREGINIEFKIVIGCTVKGDEENIWA